MQAMNMQNRGRLKAVLFHLPFIIGFWVWVTKYYPAAVEQFSGTYQGFAMRVPQATAASISFFSNPVVSVSVVAILSLLAAFFLKGKAKYFAAIIPLLAGLASVFFLYLPVFFHGAVI